MTSEALGAEGVVARHGAAAAKSIRNVAKSHRHASFEADGARLHSIGTGLACRAGSCSGRLPFAVIWTHCPGARTTVRACSMHPEEVLGLSIPCWRWPGAWL